MIREKVNVKKSGKLKKARRYLKYAIIFIVIIGILLAFSKLNQLKFVFLQMNLWYFGISVVFSFMVYIFEGFFLLVSLRAFGERLPIGKAIKYSLLINSLGYLVSLGGLTPFATQVYILDYDDISPKKATLTRILQAVLFNLLFNILVIVGFLYIILGKKDIGFSKISMTIAMLVFFIISTIAYLTVFWKKFRNFSMNILISGINKIIRIFSKKKQINPENIERYINDFHVGFKNLLAHPRLAIIIILITLIDWFLWVGVLFFTFKAVHFTINLGELLIGFAAGQTVAIISMVPGGAGTMEGSMALIFSAFGIQFETALGAVLLYRVSFYIIPFLISLPLYLSLKKKIQEG